MELGKAKLRRNGMNNLQNALHPEHGLIWTDGKGIFLTPVRLCHDQVEKSSSTRLGEFDYVQSVHWSCPIEQDACYMAAVHNQNVTVWHVSGAVPRLAFKQVRKISVQAIPQGCLWNPKTDVLCLLSRQQCSFYFRHSHNRGSFAFPSLENEKISFGCWSPDGKRLVICVGTALLIYTWADVEANINDFVTTAWRIPGMYGCITAVVPVSNSSVVCASDLPLDVLCQNNNKDSFVMPEVGKTQVGPDNTIQIHGGMSVKDSLLNLQPSQKSQVQDAAMLSLIQLKSALEDPLVLSTTVIPGLLSPDLLYFQLQSQCVVVGSNTQCGVQVFALVDNQLQPAGNMQMEKCQRPKGICGLCTPRETGPHGALVLVGMTEPVDPAFLSANNTALFTLSLQFFPTKPENAKRLVNGHATSSKPTSSVVKSNSSHGPKTNGASDSRLHSHQSCDEQPEHRQQSSDQELADGYSIRISLAEENSKGSGVKLIEEIRDSSRGSVKVDGAKDQVSSSQVLETDRVEFSQSSPSFSNSVLSQKYNMNQNKDKPDTKQTVDTHLTSQTIATSHKDSTKDDKKSSKISNSVDKHDPTNTSRRKENMVINSQQNTDPLLLPHIRPDGEGRLKADDSGSVCSSFNSSDSNYELLEKQIQTQRDQIEALQKRLNHLSEIVQDTTCVFPVRYQKISEPEALTIQCVVGGARVSRKFLLDNGRLQLDPVKQAFGLLTVELILDGEPLVLGANIDGYIPMKFSASSIVQITGIPITYAPQLAPERRKKDPS